MIFPGAWIAQNAAKGSTRKYTGSGTQARQESPGSQKNPSKTSPSSLLSPLLSYPKQSTKRALPHTGRQTQYGRQVAPLHSRTITTSSALTSWHQNRAHPGWQPQAHPRRNRPQLAHPRGQNPSSADHERRPHWAAPGAVAKSSALISLPLVARPHSQCRRRRCSQALTKQRERLREIVKSHASR